MSSALKFAAPTAFASASRYGKLAAEPSGILGSKLKIWLDAEDTDYLLNNAGVPVSNGQTVREWASKVGSARFEQATDALRAIYGAATFGGRPGLTGDGSNDVMSILAGSPADLADGAEDGEIWARYENLTPDATTTLQWVVGYGQNTAHNGRGITRQKVSGQSRMVPYDSTSGPNGVQQMTGPQWGAAFFYTDASVQYVGGSEGGTLLTPVASAFNTNTTAACLWSRPSSSAGSFFNGRIAEVLFVAGRTDADERAALKTYLDGRLAA